MHNEILNPGQKDLLTLVKCFRREYYLAGGTAVALYLGHRRSLDFDLFKYNSVNPVKIISKISKLGFHPAVTRRSQEQLNLIVSDIKFTFLEYPFNIRPVNELKGIIRVPDLLDLASMKAYALGRRSKWKDYVDMYFLLRDFYTLSEISEKAGNIFGPLFSEKLFRAQLCYFDDIDYSEEIDYLVPAVLPKAIKEFLISKATDLRL